MVTYRNQLEVMLNLFFLAVLKLEVDDSFGYDNKMERMGKTSTIWTYYIETLPSMYFININIT